MIGNNLESTRARHNTIRHILMAPAGLPMAIVVSLLALFLLGRNREHFAGLVKNAPVSDLPRLPIATGNAGEITAGA